MKRIKARKLVFQKLDAENIPNNIKCCYCGDSLANRTHVYGCDIPIEIGNDHLSLLACSMLHVRAFKRHSGADKYVRSLYTQAFQAAKDQARKAMDTSEFLEMIQKAVQVMGLEISPIPEDANLDGNESPPSN